MSFLDDRRRGAEEAFFAKQNELLRVQMRASSTSDATHQDLKAASGLTNDAVLATLKALNVGPEGAAAVSLIPLVAVAWADGEVSGPERDALLKAAAQAGLEENSPGYQVFSSWLAEAPPSRLMARWKDYAKLCRPAWHLRRGMRSGTRFSARHAPLRPQPAAFSASTRCRPPKMPCCATSRRA